MQNTTIKYTRNMFTHKWDLRFRRLHPIIKIVANISCGIALKSLITALILLVMVSCGSKNEEMQKGNHENEEESNIIELTQAQYDQAGILISKIEKRTIDSGLKVNGVIDVPPQNNISINMPYGGFVKYIDMLPGTKVKKGQLLVIISNPDFIQFQQEYLESQINREYLKADYERQEELYKENVTSSKKYQQAKSIYLSNEARIKTMEERLNLIGFNPAKVRKGEISASVNIYSPVSGSIRDVFTNVGKYINPKDVIMDITNSDDLHVELTVYENDIPQVKSGQRIRFTLANSPDNLREAEVFLVGSDVREDRSVTVHGHLKEKYEDLLSGMYVSAEIGINSDSVWAAPDESIVRFNGKHYVFAYKNKRQEDDQIVHDFEMLEVMKGDSEGGFWEIALVDPFMEISKLSIITKGAFTVLSKAKNSEEGGGHGH